MSAYVLLNLSKKFRKRDSLLSILSIFHNKFDQFNNSGA